MCNRYLYDERVDIYGRMDRCLSEEHRGRSWRWCNSPCASMQRVKDMDGTSCSRAHSIQMEHLKCNQSCNETNVTPAHRGIPPPTNDLQLPATTHLGCKGKMHIHPKHTDKEQAVAKHHPPKRETSRSAPVYRLE